MVEFHEGERRLGLCRGLWRELDGAGRRQSLWDKPEAWADDEGLALTYGNAGLCGFGIHSGRLCAAAAVFDKGPGGTGEAHFCMAPGLDPEARLAIGMEFLAGAMLRYEALYCVIPAQWRGARAYAKSLGFRSVIVLPGLVKPAFAKRKLAAEFLVYGG